jgi:hypothetical protein
MGGSSVVVQPRQRSFPAVTLPAYTSGGRLLVELLAHVLVTVGGIVTYAPVQLKRLV